MINNIGSLGKIFLISLGLSHSSANANDIERGHLLYENHCTTCHQSNIHIRKNNKAKTIHDIRYQIERWRNELNLQWSEQEIADVLSYLNQNYYHYSKKQK